MPSTATLLATLLSFCSVTAQLSFTGFLFSSDTPDDLESMTHEVDNNNIYYHIFKFALRCLEGADCLRDASCLECEGVACMRIISFNLEDNREVALTCVPSDTRRYGLGYPLREPYLEAEGCENTGDRRICVCYGRDYCNHSSSRVFLLPVLLIVTLL